MASKKVYHLMNCIKVGYSNYIIKSVSKKEAAKKKVLGEVDFETKTIIYDVSQTKIELFNTIIHEIFHTVGRFYGIDDLNSKLEERIVKAFADGLTIVCLENEGLLPWMNQIIQEVREENNDGQNSNGKTG